MIASGWISAEQNPEDCPGVLLRRTRGSYVTPPEEAHHVLLGAAIRLNLVIALTMRPQMLEGILKLFVSWADGATIQGWISAANH